MGAIFTRRNASTESDEEYLLDEGYVPRPHTYENVDRWTRLHKAASKGETTTVRRIISRLKKYRQLNDLRTGDKNGATPLHLAAQSGRQKTIEEILKSQKSEDHKMLLLLRLDNYSRTPLHPAAKNGYTDTVRSILTCLSPESQMSVLTVADKHGATPLYLACLMNQSDTVCCIINSGISTKERMNILIQRTALNRQTPLHTAMLFNYPETVNHLMAGLQQENKVNLLTMRDADSDTPLHSENGVKVFLPFMKDFDIQSLKRLLTTINENKIQSVVEYIMNSRHSKDFILKVIHKLTKLRIESNGNSGGREHYVGAFVDLIFGVRHLPVDNLAAILRAPSEQLKMRTLLTSLQEPTRQCLICEGLQFVHWASHNPSHYILHRKPVVLIFYMLEGREDGGMEEFMSLRTALENLPVEVRVAQDFTEQEIHEHVREVQTEHTSALFVFIMSHGARGQIITHGGARANIQDIINTMESPTLSGVPKVSSYSAAYVHYNTISEIGESFLDEKWRPSRPFFYIYIYIYV